MVNFDNVTSNVQSKPRKKTMAESLEEAKQEGKLVVPEEDTQVNAVVSSETVQPKNKARKKKQSKVRKQEEQTTVVSQANEDNDFKDAKTDKRGVPVGINVPQHILDVVCIVKFNAAFRHILLLIFFILLKMMEEYVILKVLMLTSYGISLELLLMVDFVENIDIQMIYSLML